MIKNPSQDSCTSTAVSKNAIKNYKTYVAHYKSKNLIPMPLNDFLNNYKTSLIP
ncbi:MAG: hypothetical protein JKY16_05170 [Lutibacter sp.]|nr:hypothetical protein [Lutibacter sp.]